MRAVLGRAPCREWFDGSCIGRLQSLDSVRQVLFWVIALFAFGSDKGRMSVHLASKRALSRILSLSRRFGQQNERRHDDIFFGIRACLTVKRGYLWDYGKIISKILAMAETLK